MTKYLYRIFEKIGNLYIWCIGVTCAGIGACVLYGILLDDYLEWKSSKDRLERELSELTQQYEEEAKKATALKLELATLENKKNQLDSIDKRILELQPVIDAKQKNDSRLDGAIEQKQLELQSKTDELAKLTEKATLLASELSTLTDNVTCKKEEYEKIKAKIDSLTEISKKKSEEIHQLNLELKELTEKKQTLQAQNNELQQNLKEEAQLKERIKTLRTEYNTAQKQLTETQSKINELTGSKANAKRIEMEHKLAKLQEEKKAAEIELKEKTTDTKNASAELAEITRKRDILKTECTSLETIKTEKQNALDAVNREYNSRLHQCQTIETTIAQKNDELESLTKAIDELEKRKTTLQAECTAIEESIKKNRAEETK